MTAGRPVSYAEFEKSLRADLPRGWSAQVRTGGQDRGLDAHWLAPEDMRPVNGKDWAVGNGLLGDAIMLGRRLGKVIGWKDDRHLMLIGGSRAGKGVALIIPNLIAYQGSALIIDPKGENARFTAGRRGEGVKVGDRIVGPGLGQDVHVVDPFGVSGRQPVASFNPLAELDLYSSNVAEDAALFADALIEHPDSGDKHWTQSAQSLVRALILVALADRRPWRRNLVTMRRLLTLTDRGLKEVKARVRKEKKKRINLFDALLELLRDQRGPYHAEICTGVAEQLNAMGENELGSVLSTARTQTRWLDDRGMHRVLCRSDFRMADLKLKPTSIYLCLPAMRMGTHACWLRLVIMLALSVMERIADRPIIPVLFVLDEFPVLGHMRSIEMGAGLMAGFGVKLWTILQDVGQLQHHYAKTWQTFMANSGVVTAFGVSDHQTAQALSKRLGHLRMKHQIASDASPRDMLSGAPAFRDERFDTPLLAGDEIGRVFGRNEKRVLILGAGYRPAVAQRFEYYEDPLFDKLYDDPKWGGRKV